MEKKTQTYQSDSVADRISQSMNEGRSLLKGVIIQK